MSIFTNVIESCSLLNLSNIGPILLVNCRAKKLSKLSKKGRSEVTYLLAGRTPGCRLSKIQVEHVSRDDECTKFVRYIQGSSLVQHC